MVDSWIAEPPRAGGAEECEVRAVLPGGERSWAIARRVRIARSLRDRTVGLLDRARLDPDEGLWLVPCMQIHMLGMRFAIDVLYIGRRGEILGEERGLAPWRIGKWVPRTRSVLELAAGALAGAGEVPRGARIEWKARESDRVDAS